MFVKQYAPLIIIFICHRCFAVQSKLHKCMKKKFILGNCPVTWTFEPVTPKSIWFPCCTGRMCGPSLRKVGQGILALLIGNEKVIDGHTDILTDMCKAIYPLFFEGGHKKVLLPPDLGSFPFINSKPIC